MQEKEQNIHDVFFDNIRDKIGDIEKPYEAAHWDKMAATLDSFETEDADFDSLMRQKIAAVEAPVSIGHWDKMAASLDALDAEETTFDEAIRAKMGNMQPHYEAAHWDKMSALLDAEQQTWRARIVRYKIVEVSVLLLAVFTILNTYDNDGAPLNNRIEIKKEMPSRFDHNQIKVQSTPAQENTPSSNNSPVVDNNATIFNNENIAIEENLYNISKAQAAFMHNNMAKNTAFAPPLSIYKHNLETLPNIDLSKEQIVSVDANMPNLLENRTEIVSNFTQNSTVLSVEKMGLKPKSKWRIGTFAATNAHLVSTAFNFSNGLLKSKQFTGSSSAGTQLAYQKGRFELETGVSATQISYEPPKVTAISGSFARGYIVETPKTIDLDIVSVPLSINGFLKPEKSKWNFFAQLGASLNFITNLKDNREITINNMRSFAMLNTNKADLVSNMPRYPTGIFAYDIVSEEAENSAQTKLIAEESPRSIKQNTYATAHIGIGVERKISKRLSLIAQPTLSRHIGKAGIGSNDDKINTLAIRVGVKTII